jgi:quinol monooxygenase YgiN
MIIVAGGLRIQPNSRDEASAACIEVEKATREESGCISYAFHFGIAEPDYLHVFEQWESEDALNAHMQQLHTQAFLTKVGGFAAEAPVVNIYEVASKKSLF